MNSSSAKQNKEDKLSDENFDFNKDDDDGPIIEFDDEMGFSDN